MVKKESETYTLSKHDLLDKLGIKCKKIIEVHLIDDLYASWDEPVIKIVVEVEDDEL